MMKSLENDSYYVAQVNNGSQDNVLLSTSPEFAPGRNLDLKIIIDLLDQNAMQELPFDQKRNLLVFYIWQRGFSVKTLRISGEEKQRIVKEVLFNYAERWERLEGMVKMFKRVTKRGVRNPKITEFDYWVYTWSMSSSQPTDIIEHIPPEFCINGATVGQMYQRIDFSILKLGDYGETGRGLKRIKRLIREWEATEGIQNREGALKYLRRKMSPKEKQLLIGSISKVMGNLEAQGRSWKKGEIPPREIAFILSMDPDFITSFIRNNTDRLYLPRRENPYLGKLNKQKQTKEQIRKLLQENPSLAASEMLRLLSENNGSVIYTEEAIRNFMRQIRSESLSKN